MMWHSLWFHANLLFRNLVSFSEHLKWHFGIVFGCELKFTLAFSCCSFTQRESGNQVFLTGLLLSILIKFWMLKQPPFYLKGYLRKMYLFALSSSYDSALCVMDVIWPYPQFACRMHPLNLVKYWSDLVSQISSKM